MGFYDVIEVALGADMVVENETKEFIETIEDCTKLPLEMGLKTKMK